MKQLTSYVVVGGPCHGTTIQEDISIRGWTVLWHKSPVEFSTTWRHHVCMDYDRVRYEVERIDAGIGSMRFTGSYLRWEHLKAGYDADRAALGLMLSGVIGLLGMKKA